MSENIDETTTSQYDGDIDDHDRTLEQQAEAAIELDDPTATDDVPWSPPEKRPIGAEFADAEEQDPDYTETIDTRIRQEEPEEGTAYGAPGRDEAGELAPLPEDEDDDPLAIDPAIDVERPQI